MKTWGFLIPFSQPGLKNEKANEHTTAFTTSPLVNGFECC